MECCTCKSNIGEKRISPSPAISEGKYWLVEHASPVKVIGWIVIVLKRLAELARIQARLIPLLHEELHCEKEYVSCYAEMEHFRQIHFYVFAKSADLPEELKGGKSFTLLKVTPEQAVPPTAIISFCGLLRDKLTYTPQI